VLERVFWRTWATATLEGAWSIGADVGTATVVRVALVDVYRYGWLCLYLEAFKMAENIFMDIF
jgi:hypothetical protein